jgi:cyclopropane-fatty-acyl-phospholipid synthase
VDHHFQKIRKGRLTIEDQTSGKTYVYGNGQGIKARIVVKDQAFFRKLVLATDIGLGESYVDGDWETDSIFDVIRWFISNIEDAPSMSGGKVLRNLLVNMFGAFNRAQHILNSNSVRGSKKNITEHYDLGNEFFASFLDETMTYSSGIWLDESEDLKTAQYNKLRNMAEMAGVKPQHRVLEIGTGWGEFSCFLAAEYGCDVTTLTISDQQHAYALNKVRQRGLSDKVTIHNMDYRKFQGSFDRIFTVEMMEAVGHDYLPEFFAKCATWLKPTGTMVHQVILSPDSRYEQFRSGVDWIQKHVFPGSLLPSVSAILGAANSSSHEFVLKDFKDIGLDYAKTLQIWRDNFETNAPLIRSLGFSESFRRKWNYYFAYCEAAFFMRNITVAQLALTRPNNFRPD